MLILTLEVDLLAALLWTGKGVGGGGFTVSTCSKVTEGGRETGIVEVHILILEADFLPALLWTGMGVGGGGIAVSTSSGVREDGREWTREVHIPILEVAFLPALLWIGMGVDRAGKQMGGGLSESIDFCLFFFGADS